MLKYFILFIILIPSTFATEKVRNRFYIENRRIYEQILKNNPYINKQYALKLSYIIVKVSIKRNVNPRQLTAILAQESMYKLGKINRMTQDYSIGQININNIIKYKFNIKKLIKDLNYSIDCSALILSELRSKYKNESNYWSRYNSFNLKLRKVYEKKVKKYL